MNPRPSKAARERLETLANTVGSLTARVIFLHVLSVHVLNTPSFPQPNRAFAWPSCKLIDRSVGYRPDNDHLMDCKDTDGNDGTNSANTGVSIRSI